MAQTTAFTTAKALLSGQPGNLVERPTAHCIARSLTPVERGSLLALSWADLHALDGVASSRNVLAHILAHMLAHMLACQPKAPHRSLMPPI